MDANTSSTLALTALAFHGSQTGLLALIVWELRDLRHRTRALEQRELDRLETDRVQRHRRATDED